MLFSRSPARPLSRSPACPISCSPGRPLSGVLGMLRLLTKLRLAPRHHPPTTTTTNVQVLRMVMKCADLGHLVQPFAQAEVWDDLLMDEFFHQGDVEKVFRSWA